MTEIYLTAAVILFHFLQIKRHIVIPPILNIPFIIDSLEVFKPKLFSLSRKLSRSFKNMENNIGDKFSPSQSIPTFKNVG